MIDNLSLKEIQSILQQVKDAGRVQVLQPTRQSEFAVLRKLGQKINIDTCIGEQVLIYKNDRNETRIKIIFYPGAADETIEAKKFIKYLEELEAFYMYFQRSKISNEFICIDEETFWDFIA